MSVIGPITDIDSPEEGIMLRNLFARIKATFLHREPALWASTFASALGFLATLNLHGLGPKQAALIVAAVNACGAAVVAWRTRPIAPAVFTGALSSLVSLAAAYGLHVQAGQVGTLNVVVLAVLALLTRGQVSPIAPSVVPPAPVRAAAKKAA